MKTFEQVCLEAVAAKGIDWRSAVCPRSIRIINKIARATDDRDLWPFVPSADKAIRWYSRLYFPANGPCSVLEYIRGLESRMADYVNGSN